MYLGHIDHLAFHLPTAIQKALDYCRNTDLATLEAGRYNIEGDDMFALVQDPMTQSWDSGYPEFHARYVDVQYLIAGEEIIGYLPANAALVPITNQLIDNDIAFVPQQINETKLVLTPGMYAVFFPGELHRPCRAVKENMHIKKVVIKIAMKTI